MKPPKVTNGHKLFMKLSNIKKAIAYCHSQYNYWCCYVVGMCSTLTNVVITAPKGDLGSILLRYCVGGTQTYFMSVWLILVRTRCVSANHPSPTTDCHSFTQCIVSETNLLHQIKTTITDSC